MPLKLINTMIIVPIYHQQFLNEKKLSLISEKGVLLQHDTAQPTAKITIKKKLKTTTKEKIPYPSYSSDLAL